MLKRIITKRVSVFSSVFSITHYMFDEIPTIAFEGFLMRNYCFNNLFDEIPNYCSLSV